MDRDTQHWPTGSVVLVGVLMVLVGIVNVVQPDFGHWFRSSVLGRSGREPSRFDIVSTRVAGVALVGGGAAMFVYAAYR